MRKKRSAKKSSTMTEVSQPPINSSTTKVTEGRDIEKMSESNNENTNKAGAFGLDIGTSRIVFAKGEGKSQSQSQLNAFLTVPYSKMTESILKQRKITYTKNNTSLFVYGNDSETFAGVFNIAPRRPMSHGVLNASETMGLQIIQAVIELVLPRSQKKDMLCFSIPAGSGNELDDANLVYHEAVVKSFLESRGYQAKAVNEGLAVVFSELQEENFTGIGISCGGGMCNVCVSFLAVPVVSFSMAKAGDYVDASASIATGESSPKVRDYKEHQLDLSRSPRDKIENALHIYYEDVLHSLISKLTEEFENSQSIPKVDRPLPMILSGGTSKPKGFLQKFDQMLKNSNFPIPVSEVRLAKNPLTATAEGCYVAAMSELE
jgi:actin-like ATPase involved in cell morphogenesis